VIDESLQRATNPSLKPATLGDALVAAIDAEVSAALRSRAPSRGVDHHFELGRKFDWQVGRLGALQDFQTEAMQSSRPPSTIPASSVSLASTGLGIVVCYCRVIMS
jgi:hypothetical protein